MTVSDYSALFDLLIDGAVRRSTQTLDNYILEEPARLLMELREALPIIERVKLHEAIMQSAPSLLESSEDKIARLTA